MDASDFAQMLRQIPERLADASYSVPLEKAGRVVNQEVAQNFIRQVDSQGEQWAPHAPLTIKLYGVHPLLRLSWDMHAAATNMDDPRARKSLSGRELEMGIDGDAIPYARVQNEGEGRIPAREFFYVDEHRQENLAEVFHTHAQPIVERMFSP